MNYIPGFRTKKKWKMILAGIYYLLSLSALTSGIGMFLVAISLPFIVFNIIKGIKTKNKQILASGIIAIILFFIGAKLIPSQPTNNTVTTKNTTIQTETTAKVRTNQKAVTKTTQAPVEKSKPAATPTFEDGTITNYTVKVALLKVHDTNVIDINSSDFKSIDVESYIGDNTTDENNKVVIITVKPKQIWDETDLAKKAASSMANYCEILSKNKNVKRIKLVVLADFTDSYGNSNENTALWIVWDRDTLDKVNYKNFENMIYGDYTKAYQIADSYNFSYGIYKKLKNFNGLPASK